MFENQDTSKEIVVKGDEKCSLGSDSRERQRTMEMEPITRMVNVTGNRRRAGSCDSAASTSTMAGVGENLD